ncbi:MAG: hypothetical protein ACLUHE_09365 [Christensenellales bacterium]
MLDAFGINRASPCADCIGYLHDGALRREMEVNPCPARRGALRSSAAEKVNPAWLPARITPAKRNTPNTNAAGNKAVSFLSNHELYTVGQLGRYIAETQRTFSKIKAESTAKERRIRDIDALFGAIQTIRELKPVQQEYENIHWNGKREKFKTEHGEELNRLKKAIWLCEKLVKSLGFASHLDKEQRAALKTERAQIDAEREALLPKLEEVKAEMAELNRIRYWTRKVIPDALPRISDGRVSVEDAIETAINRKELKETTETAAQTVLKRNREESVQHVLLRSHPPEL